MDYHYILRTLTIGNFTLFVQIALALLMACDPSDPLYLTRFGFLDALTYKPYRILTM